MKNKEVITRVKNDLAYQGLIDSTVENGRIIPNEDIYTKNVWRKLGCRINKNEAPIATIPIYVVAPHKVYEDGKPKIAKMLGVRANFYKQSQVSRID